MVGVDEAGGCQLSVVVGLRLGDGRYERCEKAVEEAAQRH